MLRFKCKILLAVALAWQLATALADPVTDRISVTVRGQGPDVILIPGLASSGAVWSGIADHLEANYRVHIVQINGFAGLPALANGHGPVIPPVIHAIDTYIKTNQLKATKIIGHSMGGLIGLMLAAQHPEEVDRLMIVDSLPFYGVLTGATDTTNAAPQAAILRDIIIGQSQNDYAQTERQYLQNLVKSPQGRNAAIAWAVTSDKSVVARALYDDATTDMRGKLATIKTPVTVLYPWDPLTGFAQSATDNLYQGEFAALPDKKLVRIDGSFHFIMLDQPDVFAAQVDAFLK